MGTTESYKEITEGYNDSSCSDEDCWVIAYRVAIGRAKCLTDKDGDHWYNKAAPPCVQEEDAIIGFARNGHPNETRGASDLNKVAEFCLLNPKLAVPVAAAKLKFVRNGFGQQ